MLALCSSADNSGQAASQPAQAGKQFFWRQFASDLQLPRPHDVQINLFAGLQVEGLHDRGRHTTAAGKRTAREFPHLATCIALPPLDIQSYQSISDLPTVVYQQIKTADAETLPRWSECVLTARTRMGEQTARTARYCAWLLTVLGAVEGGKGT